MGKTLEYYMSLTYPAEVVREENGIVVALHPDLTGCIAQGETADEALANLDEARVAWMEVRLAENLPIPEPPDENYGGKILVRMMPALHAAIARRANRQGVSVNQFIVATLAESAGFAKATDHIIGIVRDEMSSALSVALRSQNAMRLQANRAFSPMLSQAQLILPSQRSH
jgi:antitoxin HicB